MCGNLQLILQITSKLGLLLHDQGGHVFPAIAIAEAVKKLVRTEGSEVEVRHMMLKFAFRYSKCQLLTCTRESNVHFAIILGTTAQ